MFKTANPALNSKSFKAASYSGNNAMTIEGTVNKCLILLGLVILTASWTWSQFMSKGLVSVSGLMMIGGIVALIAALISIFNHRVIHITAPIYAAAEGLFLGGFSAMLETQYPGLVIQAVGLTFGTLFCLLAAYKSGKIKVTENMRLGILAATGGLALFYFITFILSMFGMGFGMNIILGNGVIGIGFSLFVVAIAALNLVLDFDVIEKGAANGAPKQMEWYGAFGLMVTLVWLYIEILRLLAKLRSRD
jgi:uncharacterized YccA/Bax inhibitor family protein